MSETAQAQWEGGWQVEAEETPEASDQQKLWFPVQITGASISVVLFGILLFELLLAGVTTALAWTLTALLMVTTVGQGVAMILQQRWSGQISAQHLQPDEEQAGEEAQQEWPEAEEWPQAAEEVLTVGCPQCGTAFVVSPESASTGRFHCTNCGVEGFVNDYDLDAEVLQEVTCSSCHLAFQAHQDNSQCPECGTKQELAQPA